MRQKVVVVGAGVGGLTAAHELVERGFEVHVYERRSFAGGKAASVRVAADGKPADLPGEHGFRFFPSWYRHLPDTMKRIPFRGSRLYFEGATVYDNLVPAEVNLLTWYDREPTPLPMHLPRSTSQFRALVEFGTGLKRFGLANAEISFFLTKLATFLTTPEPQRAECFQKITWWEYVEAGSKSPAYQSLVSASTRTMVAAKATEACAYTIGKLALRTLFDSVSQVDRVLNGPTSEVWIEPWVEHLERRGVKFHYGHEFESIEFEAEPRVQALVFSSQLANDIGRLRAMLEPWKYDYNSLIGGSPDASGDAPRGRGPGQKLRGTAYRSRLARFEELQKSALQLRASLAVALERLDGDPRGLDKRLIAQARQELEALKKNLEKGPHNQTARLPEPGANPPLGDFAQVVQHKSGLRQIERALAPSTVHADYFVFSLPVEQMAYYVNRSGAAREHDANLEWIVRLADSTDWMAGVQFYLREPVHLAPGHVIGMDSEWGITAIEQTQFWKDVPLPAGVESIISVDVAAWDRRGREVPKEAYNCSNEEIAREVWAQLEAGLNRSTQQRRLDQRMLVGGALKKGESFHIDDSIVDVFDRKKQGAYERARSVRFSAIEPSLAEPGSQVNTPATPYVWGPRLRYNAEPLLVNRVGTYALRPEARTRITNLFLASDYVRTETDLACMEGANEAARSAVNALLDVAASSAKRCETWSFGAATQLAEALLGAADLSKGGNQAVAAFKSATSMADGVLGIAGQAASGLRRIWEKK